jgi:hypothetical protein
MKLFDHRDGNREQESDLARELGVVAVFDATEPMWYSRLTARFRLTWRREAVAVIGVFVAGALVGFLVAHV